MSRVSRRFVIFPMMISLTRSIIRARVNVQRYRRDLSMFDDFDGGGGGGGKGMDDLWNSLDW